MSKDSRSGGKYTGSHTSLIPAAAKICDIANRCPNVTKISPGFIKAGLPSARGNRRVKITVSDGSMLLSIRDNASHQEVRVYATDIHAAKYAIARGCKDEGITVSFREIA